MHRTSHIDSAAGQAWSTPRLMRLGTIADVANSTQVNLTQTAQSKS